jgi:hypothetical protein
MTKSRCLSLRRGAGPGFPSIVRHHRDQFVGGDRLQALGNGGEDVQPKAFTAPTSNKINVGCR